MSDEVVSRRVFLRCAVLGALVAGTGALVVRRPGERNPVDENCRKVIACGGCALFDNCTLPRAEAARREPRPPEEEVNRG